jgi:hypothetical protein
VGIANSAPMIPASIPPTNVVLELLVDDREDGPDDRRRREVDERGDDADDDRAKRGSDQGNQVEQRNHDREWERRRNAEDLQDHEREDVREGARGVAEIADEVGGEVVEFARESYFSFRSFSCSFSLNALLRSCVYSGKLLTSLTVCSTTGGIRIAPMIRGVITIPM